jgi:hypothetical protein
MLHDTCNIFVVSLAQQPKNIVKLLARLSVHVRRARNDDLIIFIGKLWEQILAYDLLGKVAMGETKLMSARIITNALRGGTYKVSKSTLAESADSRHCSKRPAKPRTMSSTGSRPIN